MATVGSTCPVCRTADIVCGKWTLLIVRDLAEGRSRFCELERSLAGISPRTLSLRLRALEEEGIVSRSTFAEVPPRVEYVLTDKGTALLPIIESMRAYGSAWLGAPRTSTIARRRAPPSPPWPERLQALLRREGAALATANGGAMHNRALHAALRAFCEQAAWQLAADGPEVPFDLEEQPGSGPAPLYCYRPRTAHVVVERLGALSRLPTFPPVASALEGVGGLDGYLRVRGTPRRRRGTGPAETPRCAPS